MNLYLVQNEDVTLLMTETHKVAPIPDDDDESVLVIAASADDALAIAVKYDHGEIQTDNVKLWTGETVAALHG